MRLRPKQTRRRPVSSSNPRDDRQQDTWVSYRSAPRSEGESRGSSVDTGRHNRNLDGASGLSRILHNLPAKLAILAIAGSLLYVTILDTQVNLTTQTMASTNGLLRSKSVYQSAAQEILSASIFNRSKITINVPDFEGKMRGRFHELDSVSLTLPLIGHKPVINLATKSPLLKLVGTQGAYLLDDQGIAIMSATDALGIDGLNLPVVIDESRLEINLGKGVLTSEAAKFISLVNLQLKAKQIEVVSMTLPATADELNISLKDQPYSLRFGLDNDPIQTVGEFLALRDKLAQDGVTPREYIDLRVSERAFYK